MPECYSTTEGLFTLNICDCSIVTGRKQSLGQGNIFTGVCHYHPPTHNRSCGKVMFSQVCVKNSVHGGRCTPPWQTPPPPGRHLPPEMATESGGRHPTGMHSSSFCPQGGLVGFPASITGHITRGVSVSGGSAWGGGRPLEIHGVLHDMVNKRAVCILLKCILVVVRCVSSVSKCLEMIDLHLTPGSTVTV